MSDDKLKLEIEALKKKHRAQIAKLKREHKDRVKWLESEGEDSRRNYLRLKGMIAALIEECQPDDVDVPEIHYDFFVGDDDHAKGGM